MTRSRRPVRALWGLAGVLTLPAAVTGLLFPETYRGVVPAELLPGAVLGGLHLWKLDLDPGGGAARRTRPPLPGTETQQGSHIR